MSTTNAIFYYRNQRKKEGAFTEEEFIQLIQQEIIEPDDEIWILDMKEWMKLKDSIYAFYMKKAEQPSASSPAPEESA